MSDLDTGALGIVTDAKKMNEHEYFRVQFHGAVLFILYSHPSDLLSLLQNLAETSERPW